MRPTGILVIMIGVLVGCALALLYKIELNVDLLPLVSIALFLGMIYAFFRFGNISKILKEKRRD
jgi:hypothetical protein